MNILLWAPPVLAALLYESSGVMKVFMFDKVSQDVPSFGALPRKAWITLGIVELVCTVHSGELRRSVHGQPGISEVTGYEDFFCSDWNSENHMPIEWRYQQPPAPSSDSGSHRNRKGFGAGGNRYKEP